MASTEALLRALVPLKVVLLTESPGPEHASIRAAIARAFQGGAISADSGEAYFAAGEDLDVSILEAVFSGNGSEAMTVADNAMKDALLTLFVAVLYDVPTSNFDRWLTELDIRVQNESPDNPRLYLLPILVKEGAWQSTTQPLEYGALGERALRPVHAAVHVLAGAWRALGRDEDRLKIFVSHAKLDGLPLALSFKHQLDSFPTLGQFYDAESIPPGSNWRRVLRNGVEQSVLVTLRTNVYEERFWCVQEMDWAEDYGCPLVVVDARTQLVRAREFLPIGGAPSLHVPDGNLLRVIQSSLREAMRVRLFSRQVYAISATGQIDLKRVVKVPRTSLATLGMRCQDRARTSTDIGYVFVPEAFREAHRDVSERLVKTYFPSAWLGTPDALIETIVADSTT